MEGYFKVGKFDFTIDYENSIIEIENNRIIDLTIKSSETVFDKFCQDENFEFGWATYSPEFYAREINLNNSNSFEINENNLYDFEAALYFMNHNDVYVSLFMEKNSITTKGISDIMGKKYPIEIKIMTNI